MTSYELQLQQSANLQNNGLQPLIGLQQGRMAILQAQIARNQALQDQARAQAFQQAQQGREIAARASEGKLERQAVASNLETQQAGESKRITERAQADIEEKAEEARRAQLAVARSLGAKVDDKAALPEIQSAINTRAAVGLPDQLNQMTDLLHDPSLAGIDPAHQAVIDRQTALGVLGDQSVRNYLTTKGIAGINAILADGQPNGPQRALKIIDDAVHGNDLRWKDWFNNQRGAETALINAKIGATSAAFDQVVKGEGLANSPKAREALIAYQQAAAKAQQYGSLLNDPDLYRQAIVQHGQYVNQKYGGNLTGQGQQQNGPPGVPGQAPPLPAAFNAPGGAIGPVGPKAQAAPATSPNFQPVPSLGATLGATIGRPLAAIGGYMNSGLFPSAQPAPSPQIAPAPGSQIISPFAGGGVGGGGPPANMGFTPVQNNLVAPPSAASATKVITDALLKRIADEHGQQPATFPLNPNLYPLTPQLQY